LQKQRLFHLRSLNLASLLARQVVEALRGAHKRLATVESCTGGMVSAALTGISGASDVFENGFVTYSNAAKTAMVGVPEALLIAHGAVSQEVAASMSEGAIKATDADMAVSITGIAGPTGGSTQKPVGMVCFGLSIKGLDGAIHTQSQTQYFGNIGRDHVRKKAMSFALNWVKSSLK
jgi:nicotinamide-nucleotide amidase